jgi:alkanesulfonate monooxygenase SsuD/methylene tetrahydromethanopterin reductase-like flavin-dependent oxidoreductase (luciferase family)
MLAIIGGSAARFAPFADLFREALQQLDMPSRPIGVHSPGHIADTDEEAKEQFWPHYLDIFGRIGRQRGFREPTRESFEMEIGPYGALYVGSPETVAKKIVATLKVLGATRFDLKYAMGGLSHDKLLHNIELYGTQVAPAVRTALTKEGLA